MAKNGYKAGLYTVDVRAKDNTAKFLYYHPKDLGLSSVVGSFMTHVFKRALFLFSQAYSIWLSRERSKSSIWEC